MPNRIRELRKSRGLSQGELARNAGVNQGALSRWESGERKPTAEKALQLAGALGVTVEHLLAAPEVAAP